MRHNLKQTIWLFIQRLKNLRARIRNHAVYERFREYTMIPKDTYLANLELASRFSSIEGSLVECGTWKGGMIAGLASILGNGRSIYLYDSFEGLPPAREIDGEAALNWQSDKTSPTYFDNCKALEEDARNAMKLAGFQEAKIEKGWFHDTLPKADIPGGIAILRLDGDWYDSTMEVLMNLFKSVNGGGVIIIDDYYTWDGCSRAVHDFLSRNDCMERIDSHRGVCFIVKV